MNHKYLTHDLKLGLIAKTYIKPKTDLGPIFQIHSYTGDYKKDFERVGIGKFLRQNPFKSNCKVVFKKDKVHAVTTKPIKQGSQIFLFNFPWMEDSYIKKVQKHKDEQRKKIVIGMQ